ncbi:zinc finger protein RFP-like isoform X2 [Pelodiscus sinensis]|uniref:zinc finger protein RFP-like isoform X2 n=1 Tax=Pelodiscus sinensis TaxID=13735 RepID=UPI003F6AB7C1
MAAADPAVVFEDTASCPICLDYFNEPVTLDCGHNFCRACIRRWWEGAAAAVSCPFCLEVFPQGNFRANRQLEALVNLIVKRLKGENEQAKPGGERVCEKHQEPLKLYCEEDQTPICIVCDRARDHRAHSVVPIDEAAQEYKRHVEIEKEKVEDRFERLHRFLREQERLLLAWLDKLGQEVTARKDETVLRLTEEVSCLNTLIREMEEKCEQPACEFMQDVRSTLSRCEMKPFQAPAPAAPEPKWRLWLFSQSLAFLQDTRRKLKASLVPEPNPGRADVTLDPDTANPWLVVSADGKDVSWGVAPQDLPDHPGRFDPAPCVLASEGFACGRHSWEVEVGEEAVWVVGVAQEPVKRKGVNQFSPEQRIWAVRKYWEQHWALTCPETPLHLHGRPRRIRVYLDYEGGLVAFYDAGNQAPIFTFPPATFAGETVRPFFELLSSASQIRLCP